MTRPHLLRTLWTALWRVAIVRRGLELNGHRGVPFIVRRRFRLYVVNGRVYQKRLFPSRIVSTLT